MAEQNDREQVPEIPEEVMLGNSKVKTNTSVLSLMNEKGYIDFSLFKYFTGLRWLEVSLTDFYNLSVLQNTSEKLEVLYMACTKAWDISLLSEFTKLVRLDLSHLSVSDMSHIANLNRLIELGLSGTRITSIHVVENFPDLLELRLQATDVSDLSPLANLKALRKLNFAFTKVKDLTPLAGLTMLQELLCYKTDISDITPLLNLKSLKSLTINASVLSNENYQALREALPRCQIMGC